MRLSLTAFLALGSMPIASAAAAAGCLTPGEMPTSMLYDDGTVEEAYTVADGVQRSNTLTPNGGIEVNEMKFGFYRLQKLSGAVVTTWDWGDQTLIAAQDLPVGEDKVFDPVMIGDGGAIRATITSKGSEELTVGGCPYTVIHLTSRYDIPDGSAILSNLWIEPESMIILKSEKDRLDASGTVIDHAARMVDEVFP